MLGEQFSRVLGTQLKILENIEKWKSHHRIQFSALLQETIKTVKCIEDILLKSGKTDEVIATTNRYNRELIYSKLLMQTAREVLLHNVCSQG